MKPRNWRCQMELNPLPCYRCVFLDDLAARVCQPQSCSVLTSWILQQREVCPHCGSTHTIRSGSTKTWAGKTRSIVYRCRNCRHTFNVSVNGFTYHKKHRKEIIDVARQLSMTLSTRDVARELEARFHVKVSHVTVSKWILDPKN